MSLKVFWAVIIFNLFGSITLIIIDCDSSDEACEITAYAITDDKQIENYPEDGYKLKARALRIRNSTMPKLPAGLVRIFPAIEELSVEETQLSELNFEDLKDFTKLTILSAPNNNLTEIADDLFQNLVNLEEIDFRNNKISKIGLKSLSKLESLKTFNLSGNICVDKVFNIKTDPERKLMITEIYGKCPLESLMQRSLTNDDCQRENLLEYLGIEHESNCNQNEPQKQSDMGTPSCLLPSLPMDPSCVCVCIPNSYKSSLNLNAWRRIKDSQEFDLCPFKISQTNSLGGSIIFRPPSNPGQSPYNLSLFGIGTFPFEITVYPATSGSGSILVEKELISTSTESWIPSIPDIQVTYPPPIFPTLPSHTYPPPLPEHTTKSSGGLIPPNNSPSMFPIPGTPCFSSPFGILCTSNIPPSNLPNFPAPNYPPSNLPNFPAPNFPPQGPPFFPTPSPSIPNYPPQGPPFFPPFPLPGPWHNGMTPCELGTLIMNSNQLPNQIPAPVQQPNPLLQRSLMQPEQPSPFFQPFTFPPMEFPTFPSLIFPTFPTEPEVSTNPIPVVNLPAIPTQVTSPPVEIASQPQVINLLKEPETTESSSPDEIQLAVNPRLERRRAAGQALI